MPRFDFSAPFVAARIILPNGDAFPLWTNVGGAETSRPTIPGQGDLQALAFVQEVQVELNLSGLPQISVQLSPPFLDGMKFLDSPLADGRLRNRLEVQIGYSGGTSDGGAVLSAPFAAALVAPEVTVDMEVQIALKGQGLGSQAERQPGRVTPQSGETRMDLIRRLAAGEGGLRRTLEVDFSLISQESSAWRMLNESAEGYVQGGRSDWLALWELAERTRCFLLVVGPTVRGGASRVLWVPKNENFSGPPTRRYRLYHFPGGRLQGAVVQADRSSDVEFPLLSFSCNTEAIWNAITYQDVLNHGAVMRGVDSDTVRPSEVVVRLEDRAAPVDSGEGSETLTGTDELPDVPVQLPGDPDNADAVARVGAEVESGAGMTIQCQIETLGDPTVIPGDVVALSGLGRRFDNRVYHVYKVAHSIGLGGFSTSLTLQSGVDPATRIGGRLPTGQPNTSDVQDRPEYEATPRRESARGGE